MKSLFIVAAKAALGVCLPLATAFAAPADLVPLTQGHRDEFSVVIGRRTESVGCIYDLPGRHAISGDGRRRIVLKRCASADGAFAQTQLYVQDAARTTMKPVAVSTPTWRQGEASISDDGGYVAYTVHDAFGYQSHVYLAELQDWTDEPTSTSSAVRRFWRIDTALVEHDGHIRSAFPFVSADGRYVVFQSAGCYWVENPACATSRIYRYERDTGAITAITPHADGASGEPSISADGTRVAFSSEATNLVAGDGNGWEDVFVWDARASPTAPRYWRASRASGTPTSGADAPSFDAMISANGEFVVYTSFASDIAPTTFAPFERQNVFLYAVSVADSYPVNSPEPRECADTRSLQTGSGIWRICAWGAAQQSSWAPVISADGRYIAFITELADLAPDWDDGYGALAPGTPRPAGWTPPVQPRVLLRDMAEARFYVQSARRVSQDYESRALPGWYTTGIGFHKCAGMTAQPIHGLSLSADGASTAFQVSDAASRCQVHDPSFLSFTAPSAHATWSIHLRSGKGPRTNTDPFP